MFQGSQHLGKNAFIGLVESNGGVLNGSTRFDFTNYYEIIRARPSRRCCGPKPIGCAASTSLRRT